MPADRHSPASGGYRQAGQTVKDWTIQFYQIAPHDSGTLVLHTASHQLQEVER